MVAWARLSWRSLLRQAPFEPYEDPHAAPGAYVGPDPAPLWTLARAKQNRLGMYQFGLIFLIFVFLDPVVMHSAPDLLVRIAIAITIGSSYVFAAWITDAPLWTRWLYVAGFVAFLASTFSYWDWYFAAYSVYVTIMMGLLLPWSHAWIAIVVWGTFVLVIGATIGIFALIMLALMALALGLTLGAGVESDRVKRRLSRVEQRVSTLAVVAERERIGRDLHDILGHSLTAISVKSGLAERLLERDPEAAAVQVREVTAIARQALSDVRATASGMHEVRIATELASARSVLLAAGIEARVPTWVEPVDESVNELFGYVIREAVTNVVRHSEALVCTITVDPQEVVVTDDGTGYRPAADAGSGLRGLRERVQAHGGRLDVMALAPGGTVVSARLLTRQSRPGRRSAAGRSARV